MGTRMVRSPTSPFHTARQEDLANRMTGLLGEWDLRQGSSLAIHPWGRGSVRLVDCTKCTTSGTSVCAYLLHLGLTPSCLGNTNHSSNDARSVKRRGRLIRGVIRSPRRSNSLRTWTPTFCVLFHSAPFVKSCVLCQGDPVLCVLNGLKSCNSEFTAFIFQVNALQNRRLNSTTFVAHRRHDYSRVWP